MYLGRLPFLPLHLLLLRRLLSGAIPSQKRINQIARYVSDSRQLLSSVFKQRRHAIWLRASVLGYFCASTSVEQSLLILQLCIDMAFQRPCILLLHMAG
jgi:hypothetical protein